MKKLVLEFFGDELFRVEFAHSLVSGSRFSVRGKTSGAFASNQGTFQWSPAVQALASLLLKEAAAFRENNINPKLAFIAGNSTSPAASLIHALRKPPTWLHDMFGTATKGAPIARRLIARSASVPNKMSIVCLSLRRQVLSGAEIVIFQNGHRLLDPLLLNALAERIECKSEARKATNKPYPLLFSTEDQLRDSAPARLPALFNQRNYLEKVSHAYCIEIKEMLYATDIFSRPGLKKVLVRIENDLAFKKEIGDDRAFISQIIENYGRSEKFAPIDESDMQSIYDKLGRPLRVACAMGSTAALSLFEYIKSVASVPMQLDCNYSYAIQISRRILQNDFSEWPDFCVMGLAPAATLIRASSQVAYQPLMLLPAMSHRIIAPTSNKTLPTSKRAQYIFLNEEPSTSAFYLESLVSLGAIDKKQVSFAHGEPNDILAAMDSGESDLRGIVFFPYYKINHLAGKAEYVDFPKNGENLKESVLFVHKSHLANRRLIKLVEALVQDAWLSMRESPALLERVVSSTLSNNHFLKFLHRSAGLS